MKIISAEEMTGRLEFCRPLHPAPDKPEGLWCIPFEFGSNEKGTRISIAKAKEIAAELRASVAEAEKRELVRAFEEEKARSEEMARWSSKYQNELFEEKRKVAELERKLRAQKKTSVRK